MKSNAPTPAARLRGFASVLDGVSYDALADAVIRRRTAQTPTFTGRRNRASRCCYEVALVAIGETLTERQLHRRDYRCHVDTRNGTGSRTEWAIGAVEAAVGFYSRSLASATVEPQNMLTAPVSSSFLSMVGRELGARGNSLFFVEVQGGRLMLTSVSAWYSIQGSPDPESHIYELTMAGPSETRTVRTPANSCLALPYQSRIGASFSWEGSPMAVASATGLLGASVEQSLNLEQKFRPGRIVYSERGR